MAIQDVNLLADERTYTEDENNTRSITETFLVRVDDWTDTGEIAREAVLDKYGQKHPTDPSLRTSSFTVGPFQLPDGGRKFWKVQIVYKNRVQTRFNIGSTPSRTTALDLPDEVVWSFERISDFVDRDALNNTTFLNTASDTFDPPLQKDNALVKVTITRNQANFSVDQAVQFMNKVNAGATTIAGYQAPNKTARIINVGASTMEEDGLSFFAVVFEIIFKPDNWTVTILNQGFNQIEAVTGKKTACLVDGKNVTKPVLLAEDGSQLPVGGTPVYVGKSVAGVGLLSPPADAIDLYAPIDFGPLNLNRQA